MASRRARSAEVDRASVAVTVGGGKCSPGLSLALVGSSGSWSGWFAGPDPEQAERDAADRRVSLGSVSEPAVASAITSRDTGAGDRDRGDVTRAEYTQLNAVMNEGRGVLRRRSRSKPPQREAHRQA